MKKIIIGVSAGIVVVFGLIVMMMSISYNNQHKEYHNRYLEMESKIENRLDVMFRVISEKLGVSDRYSNEFKEVAKINVGAFTEGGEMWKWISTTIPQLSPELYRETMVSIESERKGLENTQNAMITITKEHNNLKTKVPSSWFIKDKELMDWVVISSTETKEIMETRVDDRSIFE